MRTSHLQYTMMVEFMEVNGDLSKPSGGPRGRNYIQLKWKELTNKLNSDGSGDPRSEEKWRKVWSDYKNNCKKKSAKINRAAGGTGGGPALQLSLNELENRVMQIIGVQAATGMVVEEVGFQRDEVSEAVISQPVEPLLSQPEILEIDWNVPGTSSQPTVVPPPPPTEEQSPSPQVAPVEEVWRPPLQKKTKKDLTKIFIEADRQGREYARERDRVYENLERERLSLKNEELRVREFEVQERIRQRDVELQLQGQWLQFMKEAMEVFVKYVNKES